MRPEGCRTGVAMPIETACPGVNRAGAQPRSRFARVRSTDPACEDTSVQRVVTAELDLDLGSSVDLIFQVAAAQQVPIVSENLTFTQGDRVYTPTEIVDQSGSRLHRLTGEPGRLEVRYEATVDGQTATARTSDLEAITYLRPSRYCQSDEVFAQARRQFQGLAGARADRRGLGFRRHQHDLHARAQPRHRQRRDDPHDRSGRLPRLRARRHRAAAGDGHARALRRVLRAGPAADGLPRRRRGLSRRRLVRHRCDAAGRTAARSCASRRDGTPPIARSSATTAATSGSRTCGWTPGSCPMRHRRRTRGGRPPRCARARARATATRHPTRRSTISPTLIQLA